MLIIVFSPCPVFADLNNLRKQDGLFSSPELFWFFPDQLIYIVQARSRYKIKQETLYRIISCLLFLFFVCLTGSVSRFPPAWKFELNFQTRDATMYRNLSLLSGTAIWKRYGYCNQNRILAFLFSVLR